MNSQLTKQAALFLTFIIFNVTALAQDGKLLDIDIDINKKEWYENPYVWVGLGIFIILLVAVSRINRK